MRDEPSTRGHGASKFRAPKGRTDRAELNDGPPIPPEAQPVFERLLGFPVSLSGLSTLFQPDTTDFRIFAVEVRRAPDFAAECTLIGVRRDGVPAYHARRALTLTATGDLELHHGPNLLTDAARPFAIGERVLEREIDLLEWLSPGAHSRITMDAYGERRFLCAVHGFEFADETEDGPPIRSERALDPEGDRRQLQERAHAFLANLADDKGLGQIERDALDEAISSARYPTDIVRLGAHLSDEANQKLGELGDSKMALGKAVLLDEHAPHWRAALYPAARHPAQRFGHAYRRTIALRRLRDRDERLRQASDQLNHSARAQRVTGIETLGLWGHGAHREQLLRFEEGSDRTVARAARTARRMIQGTRLMDRIEAVATHASTPVATRALALRILSEFDPARVAPRRIWLRTHPDARVQRAAIPLARQDADPAPHLASLLAANPWLKPPARPGLLELRLEIIDALEALADPRSIPSLILALRNDPPPSMAERAALSRAMVAMDDPRAQAALRAVTKQSQRPAVP